MVLAAAAFIGYSLIGPLSPAGEADVITSIAVLPFENRGDDPELEYLGDGIAQGVNNRLSQLGALDRVISSSSTSTYKGKDVDAATIAAELGVEAVVMVSMIPLEDTVTVNVELVDGTNSLIWGDRFVRPRSSVQELEEAVALQLVSALGLQLTEDDENNGYRTPDRKLGGLRTVPTRAVLLGQE